jgi:hypothetical protein
VIAAGLLAAVPASHAQSAYDYPWCAMYTDGNGPGGAMSCYYASFAQCMATMSGIGGNCIRSPYYREPQPVARPGRGHRRDY